MSSSGEMKTSLKLMICKRGQHELVGRREGATNVLVLYVLEELEFTVGALGENGGGEGLHDLLDRDGRAGQLILRRAMVSLSSWIALRGDATRKDEPDETERAWAKGRVNVSPGRRRWEKN